MHLWEFGGESRVVLNQQTSILRALLCWRVLPEASLSINRRVGSHQRVKQSKNILFLCFTAWLLPTLLSLFINCQARSTTATLSGQPANESYTHSAKVKFNLCIRHMTQICSKILWILPWPMIHPFIKFHQSSFLVILTNKPPIQTKNMISLEVMSGHLKKQQKWRTTGLFTFG